MSEDQDQLPLFPRDALDLSKITPADVDECTKALAWLADEGNPFAEWLLTLSAEVMTQKLNATPDQEVQA